MSNFELDPAGSTDLLVLYMRERLDLDLPGFNLGNETARRTPVSPGQFLDSV